MMAEAHSFFFVLPAWVGVIALILMWVLLRSFLLRKQRRATQGIMQRMQAATGPREHGQIQCPRCTASAPPVASFCPHCGLAFSSLPAAMPQAQWEPKRKDNTFALLVCISVAVVLMVAWIYWVHWATDRTAPSPPPVVAPREHIHEH